MNLIALELDHVLIVHLAKAPKELFSLLLADLYFFPGTFRFLDFIPHM